MNELDEKESAGVDKIKKNLWTFVGSKTKGKNKNITSLTSDTGLSLTSKRGKLEMLQNYYQRVR